MKLKTSSSPRMLRLGRPMIPYAKGGMLVTPAFNRWMRQTGGELTLSQPTLDRFRELLSTPPRDRSGSFSPSARGNCLRAQALGFLGAPQGLPDVELLNLFMDGRFRHLRWQMVGLEAGFLDEVEVSVPMPGWMAKGSVDGLNRAGKWGFELKGTSMPLGALGYAWNVVADAMERGIVPATKGKGHTHVGLMWKHAHQIAGYMHQLGANGIEVDRFALVYEHKSSQEWAEFVLTPSEWLQDKVKTELAELGKSMRVRKLPPILPDCRPKTDVKCPYAAVCHDPYPHLPGKWQDYMSKEVRLVVKRSSNVSVQDTKEVRRPCTLRIIRSEPF